MVICYGNWEWVKSVTFKEATNPWMPYPSHMYPFPKPCFQSTLGSRLQIYCVFWNVCTHTPQTYKMMVNILDMWQSKRVLNKRRWKKKKSTSEMRPRTAPAYCLETISRQQQHKECSGLLKMRKESKDMPKQLEFPRQKSKQYWDHPRKRTAKDLS